VTFSVISDGKTLTTTPVLTGSSASVSLDVDITGTQLLDLVVGDGGNGNDQGLGRRPAPLQLREATLVPHGPGGTFRTVLLTAVLAVVAATLSGLS
jgi:hypothetical protein